MCRKQKVKKEKKNWNPKWIAYLGFRITGAFFGFQKSLEKSQKRAPGKGKDHQHQQKRERERETREKKKKKKKKKSVYFLLS